MAEEPPEPDVEELRHLLTLVQDGVVSRRQLLGLHFRDHDIVRMLRRRELATVFTGVYVDHTGPLTWEQREWSAVHACWPAALARESALPSPLRAGVVHVAVDLHRSVRRLRGVVVHRTAHFDERVDWMKAPPRILLPHAVIDTALAREDPFERFRVIADACQSKETTAARIGEVLAERTRVPGRDLLAGMLSDLATGANSVLERAYLELERRHGLPVGDRQARDRVTSGTIYRDVRYAAFRVDVELDSQAFHDNAKARDRDLARDLDTLVDSGETTVRLSYGQVLRNGCVTIRKVATLLEARGWQGPFLPCPDCPSP